MPKKAIEKKENANNNLFLKKENVWEKCSEDEKEIAFEFAKGYKNFLDASKTERETTKYIVELLKDNKFCDIDKIDEKNKNCKKVRGLYRIVHNKAVLVFVNGKEDISHGTHILGAHIDSPRIDLKPNPLYEDNGMTFFKTHYYGGVKKYQWTAIPLAIHGVFVKDNGEIIEVKIGEDENEPVFTITDLLPHLAADQMQKKLSEGISGEDLNLLIGSQPISTKDVKEKFKMNIMDILNKKYGIIEEDFVSSEIEIVPAFKARDVGFDQSMIGSYGQDDRICTYVALKAIVDSKEQKYSSICYFSDKEEIGSVGNTGAQSRMFEDFITDIARINGHERAEEITRKCLNNSKMISADVNAAFDPTFASVYERSNSSFMGRGVVINKYTGSRGKSGASDANAEFVAKIRGIFNKNNIIWQASELGKVDQGGGGTIALHFANLGIDVIDCGIAILSMHSPFEIASKMDIYTTYKGFVAFYEAKD